MRRLLCVPILIAILGCQTAQHPSAANLALPALFSDGMVMQQGKPVPIWGKAVPGTRIRIGMAGQRSETLTNEAGVFRAYLEPMNAGGPYELTILGDRSRVVIHDVLIGEVWLCSGQSNMAMSMQPGPHAVLNVEEELAAANYPSIRLFDVPRTTKFEPQNDCPGGAWTACSPETVKDFSAVGYFFGRDLYRNLDVPIGLINASRGASPAEAWTSSGALRSIPEWRPLMDLLPKLVAASAASEQEFKRNAARWSLDLDSLDLGYNAGKAVWADPSFDAHDWATVQAPGYWEDQGFPNLDGFVWYRKEIDLPAAWENKPLRLHLTGINDLDRTWFNGEIVGQYEGTSSLSTPRDYPVPANLARGGSNVVTVRIYDMGNNGGFIGAAADMHIDREGGASADTVSIAGAWRMKPGLDLAAAPAKPVPPVYVESNQRMPSVLYNGMIAPLVPYALRGVIWYQGEGNVGRAQQYKTLFPTMINDWRTAFRQGDLPFLFVQLASFKARTEDANAPAPIAELRDAQTFASGGPNTGMAVAIDIGDAENIHPRNKQDVGKRLALLALRQFYAKDIVANGPALATAHVDRGLVRIRFDYTDGGLKTSDGQAPRGFAVAGEDNIYHWAVARFAEGGVILASEDVAEPRHVRYGWADNPDCNLVNGAGLPCVPFQTDL